MVVVGLPAVPLPGKGLTRPRPSSRDMRLPRGLSHHGPVPPPPAPAITSPRRCRGSRPARRPGLGRPRGKNGGVPSRAPPRMAGPYKGKLAGAPASGRFGELGSRFRPRLLHIPEDRAGAAWDGALGDMQAASVPGSSSDSNTD